MRGFLGFVVLLLAALAVAALVLLPIVVRPMVVDAVREASPFGDAPLEVEVDINPVALLFGTVERIRVTGAGLQAEGADIAALDLTLTDVETGSHRFRDLSGRLLGVTLPFVQATPLVIDTIELSGASGNLAATASFDLRGTLTLIGNAFAEAGIAVDSLEVVEGGVAFAFFDQRVVVPVGAEGGSLVIPDVAGAGPLVIVAPGPDDPWRITGVAIGPTGMEVDVSLEAPIT
jgi:hypothetical protein